MRTEMKRLGVLVAAVLLALSGLIPSVAWAAGAPPYDLGVDLGNGVTMNVTETVDQKDVYAKALSAVRVWREDAYNDSSVKVYDSRSDSYITVPAYLQTHGISKEEYLEVHWSNALERIAMQRALEAYSYDDGHTRPNGESCFTASYQGTSSWGEILAWGSSDIVGAINNWASEKTVYIKYLNGEDIGDAQTGHYVQLIDPSNKYMGFAGASADYFGTAWAGEASFEADDSGESPLNIRGTYTFNVNIKDSLLDQGINVNVPATLAKGGSLALTATTKYRNGRYSLPGTWTSSNPDAATVTTDGNLTAVAYGDTVLTLQPANSSRSFTYSLRIESFTDVSSSVDHYSDIQWMASSGVSQGYDNKDGTWSYRPMTPVYRQDMAAFLRREAALMGVTDASTWKPSNSDWSRFPDVDKATPHAEDILWLAHAGITTGYPDGTFRGMNPVYRQDMAAFLHRLASLAGRGTSISASGSFPDVTATTPHAADVA